jgi:hypothetical protein
MHYPHVQAGNHDESDDDSEWTEDEEVSTPVDPVDPFLAFSDAVRHLQSAHPARFQVPPRCWAHGTLVSHVAGPQTILCKCCRDRFAATSFMHCIRPHQFHWLGFHHAGAGLWAGSGAGGGRAGFAAACRESAGQEGSRGSSNTGGSNMTVCQLWFAVALFCCAWGFSKVRATFSISE